MLQFVVLRDSFFFLTFCEATGQLHASLCVSSVDDGLCALLPAKDKRVEDPYWLRGSVPWQWGICAFLGTCMSDIYIFSIAWLFKATFEDSVVFHAAPKVAWHSGGSAQNQPEHRQARAPASGSQPLSSHPLNCCLFNIFKRKKKKKRREN